MNADELINKIKEECEFAKGDRTGAPAVGLACDILELIAEFESRTEEAPKGNGPPPPPPPLEAKSFWGGGASWC